jgi:integrase
MVPPNGRSRTRRHAQPALRQRKPKVASGRRHLRPEEAAKLIAAAGKRGRYPERDKLLLRLAYWHGLRASEAVGVRWDSFDLDGGSIDHRPGQGRQDQHAHGCQGRSGRPPEDAQGDQRTLGVETERGGPLSVDAMQYIVREAGKLAELGDELHPQWCRLRADQRRR